MIAPQILKVGAATNVFVEIQDNPDLDKKEVTIRVRNFPSRDKDLYESKVTLTAGNKFQSLAKVQVSRDSRPYCIFVWLLRFFIRIHIFLLDIWCAVTVAVVCFSSRCRYLSTSLTSTLEKNNMCILRPGSLIER